jgi:methylated-DNA-protein-cysteine methyltransferase-like protein
MHRIILVPGQLKVMYTEFTRRVIDTIKAIPPGKVLTYGAVAALSGSPRGARQVVRVLHSLSEKEGLPWHRVISAGGKISLATQEGREEQTAMLRAEGVVVSGEHQVDLKAFHWQKPTIDS